VSAAHDKDVTSHTSHRLHFSTQMAAPTKHFREHAALTRVDRASSRSEKGQCLPCSSITQACIFTVVENILKILAERIGF
jgi:hypothetical protein